MNLWTRTVEIRYWALIVIVSVAACSKSPAEKASGAPGAPVTAGYESAIAAHAMKTIFRPKDTAPAVWGPGDTYSFLVTGEETNNAFFQFEAIVPSGGGPPPHVHSREDESFYLVSGNLELLVGDQTYKAKAGDFIFVPRGTVHTFKNIGEGTAVQLVTFVPAGMEHYFREVCAEVTDRSAPVPPATDELIERMIAAGPKYGLEFPKPAAAGSK